MHSIRIHEPGGTPVTTARSTCRRQERPRSGRPSFAEHGPDNTICCGEFETRDPGGPRRPRPRGSDRQYVCDPKGSSRVVSPESTPTPCCLGSVKKMSNQSWKNAPAAHKCSQNASQITLHQTGRRKEHQKNIIKGDLKYVPRACSE